MTRIFKTAGLLLATITLSACMGSQGEVSNAAPAGPLAVHSLKSVSVSVANDAKINKLPRLDNADTSKAAAQVLASTNQVLKSGLATSFTGKAPATVKVSIVSIDMSSGAGRTVGSSSYMTTAVQVVDARTGKTIKSGTLQTEQRPFRATGNIGLIVMIASNAGSTEEKRYQELAEKFHSDLVTWLQN